MHFYIKFTCTLALLFAFNFGCDETEFPDIPSVVFTSHSGGGIAYTNDDAQSFVTLTNDEDTPDLFPALDIMSVIARQGTDIYAFIQNQGIAVSTDAGVSFDIRDTSNGLHSVIGLKLKWYDGKLYALQNFTLAVSDDKGKSWSTSAFSYTNFHPTAEGIYGVSGGQMGVYRNGVSTYLGEMGAGAVYQMTGSETKILVATSLGLYYTEDEGATFKIGLSGTAVRSASIHKGTIYAGTDTSIYTSTDGENYTDAGTSSYDGSSLVTPPINYIAHGKEKMAIAGPGNVCISFYGEVITWSCQAPGLTGNITGLAISN